MKRRLEEFKNLLEESNAFPKDELRDYYLSHANAIFKENPKIANEVLDNQTPLMWVVQQITEKGNHPIRAIYLNKLAWDLIENSHKETLNQQDNHGNTVIHYTCDMESFSVGLLDLMKEMGANFSLPNHEGITPLMKVAQQDSLDDLKFIHAYTTEKMIDSVDKLFHETALFKAVKTQKANNVFFLLQAGANVFQKNKQLQSAREWAVLENTQCPSEVLEEIISLLNVFEEKQNAENRIKKLSQVKPDPNI